MKFHKIKPRHHQIKNIAIVKILNLIQSKVHRFMFQFNLKPRNFVIQLVMNLIHQMIKNLNILDNMHHPRLNKLKKPKRYPLNLRFKNFLMKRLNSSLHSWELFKIKKLNLIPFIWRSFRITNYLQNSFKVNMQMTHYSQLQRSNTIS